MRSRSSARATLPGVLRDRRIEIALIALAVLAAGVAWGFAGQAGDRFVGGRYLTGLGAPWLVLAFAIGAALPPRHRWGAAAAAGAGLLVSGVLAYYFVHAVHRGYYDPLTLIEVAFAWSVFAAVAGAAFAAAGARWRAGAAWLGALPAAALLGEAFALAEVWQGRGPQAAIALELLAGGALLALALWRTHSPKVLVAAALLAVACGVAESEVREAARSAGWSGL